jgi:hypothetical protein
MAAMKAQAEREEVRCSCAWTPESLVQLSRVLCPAWQKALEAKLEKEKLDGVKGRLQWARCAFVFAVSRCGFLLFRLCACAVRDGRREKALVIRKRDINTVDLCFMLDLTGTMGWAAA